MKIAFQKQVKFLEKFLDKEFRLIDPELSAKMAKLYRDTLVDNIKSNRYNFTLAESTIRERLRVGAGITPLLFRGDYVKSIIIVDKVVVTVKPGKHYSGLTYAELSFILEYGRRDKGIPSFPVWRNTFKDLRGEFIRMAADHYKRKIVKEFKKKMPKMPKGRF